MKDLNEIQDSREAERDSEVYDSRGLDSLRDEYKADENDNKDAEDDLDQNYLSNSEEI
jgi:hypothetical protein